MSINNTYKSLEDLSSFAKNYKTRLSSVFTENLGKSVLTNYNIPEDSAEKFNNILNFAINCVSKDSIDLDSAHTIMSSELSKLLQKYYEQSLNDQDIFTLLYIVLTYNKEVDNYMFSNPMSSFFGITQNYKHTADYFNGIFNTIYNYTTKIDTSENKWYKREYDDSSQQTLLESLIFFYLLNELKNTYDDRLTNYINNILYTYKEKTFLKEQIFVNKYYLNPSNGKSYNYFIKNTANDSYDLCNFALTYDYYGFSKDNDYIPPMITTVYKSEIVPANDPDGNLIDLYYLEDNTNNYILISEQKLKRTEQKLFGDGEITPNTIAGIEDFITIAIDKLKSIFISTAEQSRFDTITEKLISDDYRTSLYLVKSPSTYADLMLKKNKILYKFGNDYTTNQKVSDIILNNNLNSNTTQYRYYKNCASEEEHAMAQKYQLVSYFEIIKYPIIGYEMINKFVETFSDLPGFTDDAGWDSASLTLSSNENDCRYISFAVIYKELNPKYRDVTFADITDLAIANLDESYFLDSGPNIVSPSLYQTMIGDTSLETIETNQANEENELLKSYPIRDFISSLYTNPYIIHNSRESDIIRYMAGPIYENRYGSNQSQKKEIEYFLELYQETRNYYYMKLLNKSFVHDEYYDEYEKYFIMLYTIERFISYKIDLIRDIDYFDETDIHNFLLTYGLDKLDSSAVFYKQDEYKLEIIRNFTQLVKNKGTTDVVRTLLKIFNGDDAEIEIGKYMLSDVSSGAATTSPLYVPENSTIFIANNINNKEIVEATKPELQFAYNEDGNTKFIMVSKNTINIRKIYVTNDEYSITDSLTYDIIQQNDTDLVLLKVTKQPQGRTPTIVYYPLGSFKNDQQYDTLSHNLQFIEIPYNTENETKDVINRLSTAKDYNAFTEHDQYWDNSSLTESSLSSFNINTAPTKYSTFDYSLNISEFIVKSRYALELAEYLFERAKININNNNDHTLNNTSDIFNNLVIETDLIPNLNSVLTVDKYLRIIRLIYKIIVLSYMKSIYSTYPTNSTITLNKLSINRNANFVTLMANISTRINNIIQSLSSDDYKVKNYLNNVLEYVTNNSANNTIFKNRYWPNSFYTSAKYKDNERSLPKDINVFSKYKMETTNFANTLTTLDYSFSPWKINESTNKPVDDTARVHLLFNETNDTTISRNSFNKISEYLEGINYLSLMNTERDLFYSEQTENGEYIPNLAFSYLLHELSRNNIAEANDSNIYTNLTEKILKVPYDYLLGFNNPSYHFDYRSMNFNNITAIFIEEMFKTFFTVAKTDTNTINTFDLEIDKEDYNFIKENNLLDFINNDIISNINDDATNNKYTILYNNIRPANDPETSSLINAQILKLIELCENLGDILSSQPLMQVYYQFSEEMKNTIDFLTAALRLFISYTSEISEVRSTQKYQSDAENVIPVDQYYGVYTNTVADVLYYDEQLIYTKTGGDSNA